MHIEHMGEKIQTVSCSAQLDKLKFIEFPEEFTFDAPELDGRKAGPAHLQNAKAH